MFAFRNPRYDRLIVLASIVVCASSHAHAAHLQGAERTLFLAKGLKDLTEPGEGNPRFQPGFDCGDNNDSPSYRGKPADVFDDKAPDTSDGRIMQNNISDGNRFWATYTFAEKTCVNAYSVWFTPAHKDGYNSPARAPKKFAFYGTNDADTETATWTPLGSETDETGWSLGEKRYYRCNNTEEYTSYKWECTASVSDSWMAFSELEFFNEPAEDPTALLIAANPDTLASFEDKYAATIPRTEHAIGQTVAYTVPHETIDTEDKLTRYTAVGYKLYTKNGTGGFDETESGPELTKSVTFNGTTLKLEWQFETSYKVSATKVGPGTVGETPEYSRSGSEIKLTAMPQSDDFRLQCWMVNGERRTENATETLVLTVTEPLTVQAVFLPVAEDWRIHVSPDGNDETNTGFAETSPYKSVDLAVELLRLAGYGRLHLAPGTNTYAKTIILDVPATVTGSVGNPEETVLKCTNSNGNWGNSQRMVKLNHPNAVLEGVTLAGANMGGGSPEGSAVLIETEGGTMRHCIVTNGTGRAHQGNGGVVAVKSAKGVVSHCIFRDIKAEIDTSAYLEDYNRATGGVYMNNGLLTDCLFFGCNATPTSQKYPNRGIGAIFVSGGIVQNCTLLNCTANATGGIHAKSTAQVVNTVIAGCVSGDPAFNSFRKEDTAEFIACASDDATVPEGWIQGSRSTFFGNYATDDEGNFSFSGSDLRPSELLVNKGVLKTNDPNGNLPISEFDLAGRKRVFGRTVDIGCHELNQAGFSLVVR